MGQPQYVPGEEPEEKTAATPAEPAATPAPAAVPESQKADETK